MAIAGGTSRIGRQTDHVSVTLATTLGNTPVIGTEGAAGGVIFIPSGSTITTLTYHAAPDSGGTFLPLHDSEGMAITQAVAAGNAYDLPSPCYGAGALKIVSDAAGAVELSLKG